MEFKSNVKIKSNLYIRSTADGAFSLADEDYIAQVNSRTALIKLRERADAAGANLKLSETQQNTLNGTKPGDSIIPSVGGTVISKDISMSGDTLEEPAAAVGSLNEEPDLSVSITDSGNISSVAAEIPKAVLDLSISLDNAPASEVTENPAKANEPNSLDMNAENIPEEIASVVEAAVSMEEIPAPVEEPAPPLEKLVVGLDGFSEIDGEAAKSKVIESGLDTKLVLDCVYHSEKIRVAAERAKHILGNNSGKRLLVLCKTEASADNIRQLTAEKLSDGSYIDALDVFAAKYLSKSGESTARIASLSADERLRKFNDKMKAEDFAGYDFCIIADLDELVAEHVKTVLKILVLLKCGFLLLSDKRRAALKYAPKIGNQSGYAKNFDKLCDVLPENTERLSLICEKHNLSDEIGGLINAMTEGRPADEACKALLTKMESAEISALASENNRSVVLCKDSGSAEYVSLLLHKNNIPHTLLREGRTAPVRHLADILWDSHEKIIGHDNFIKRFNARCGSEAALADKCFNALCAMTAAQSEGLEISRLAEIISLGGMPSMLLNGSSVKLAVAEIGSACGREFGKAYLVDNDFGEQQDAKLLYLATAGRNTPPTMLKLGGAPHSECNADNRRVFIGEDGKAAFSAGRPEDVDFSSFICGSVGDAVRKQAYISKNVKPGDSVTLKLNGEVYDIVHNSTVIGKTSAEFSKSITSEFGGQRYFETLPEQIGGVFVTSIVTVVSCRDSSEYEGIISPQFRDHHFWYGVEISGFGTAESIKIDNV